MTFSARALSIIFGTKYAFKVQKSIYSLKDIMYVPMNKRAFTRFIYLFSVWEALSVKKKKSEKKKQQQQRVYDQRNGKNIHYVNKFRSASLQRPFISNCRGERLLIDKDKVDEFVFFFFIIYKPFSQQQQHQHLCVCCMQESELELLCIIMPHCPRTCTLKHFAMTLPFFSSSIIKNILLGCLQAARQLFACFLHRRRAQESVFF